MDLEIQTLIENMAQNANRAETERGKRAVIGVNKNSIILANQTLISKQMEELTKQVQAINMGQAQFQQAKVHHIWQASVLRCDFCGEGHVNDECMNEVVSDDANYMGIYQKGNP